MATFDERSPKYRHCCCHIRIAAYILGVLELLSVLYILVQHSLRVILTDVQQNDDKSQQKSDASSKSLSSERWLGTGATTPLVTWAVVELFFLCLMIYGIAKNRPWLMMPQLFLQIITIIVCMILNVLMICVLVWHSETMELWYFLASAVVFAFLYEYGLVVFIRCYRYLRDKMDHDHRITHAIYVLPVRQSNENHAEIRMYSDVPPEYSTAITMKTIEEANKEGITILSHERQTEVKSNDSVVRHNEEYTQKLDLRKPIQDCQSEENAPPPTYEEAKKLQRVSIISI